LIDAIQLSAPGAFVVIDASAQTTSQRALLVLGIVAVCALAAFLNIGIFVLAAREKGRLGLLVAALAFAISFGLVLLISLACGISMRIALVISDGSAIFLTLTAIVAGSM
jgi:hypothetical protein